MSTSTKLRILVCGAGGGGHVLAGIFSLAPDVEVRVLTLDPDKARRWREVMHRDRLTVTVRKGQDEQLLVTANPFTVTSDPQAAARGCDLVIFAIPAFRHAAYLTALAPYLESGCVIIGFPGQPGFELEVREALGARLRTCTVLNFESLPWICRLVEFGQSVRITGTKERLIGAMQGDPEQRRVRDPLALLTRLLGESTTLVLSGHLLGITLRSPNAYSHPPILFSRWRNWDGQPLDRPPLFYQGVDEETAALLGQVSDEVVATSERIMAACPDADLSQVIPMYDWDIGCYRGDIGDPTNLMTALRTNAGYAGIEHPMIRTADDRYTPDFNHRFLTEDVPFGLVVVRGIAEIAGTPTPGIDAVLSWSQERLGKEYLVGSLLAGKDLAETRCPQRYGLTTLEDVLFPKWMSVHA